MMINKIFLASAVMLIEDHNFLIYLLTLRFFFLKIYNILFLFFFFLTISDMLYWRILEEEEVPRFTKCFLQT